SYVYSFECETFRRGAAVSGEPEPALGQLHPGLAVEEVEEHEDPLTRVQASFDDRREAAQGPVRDGDLAPGQLGVDLDDAVGPGTGAQVGHHLGAHPGRPVAEGDQAGGAA